MLTIPNNWRPRPYQQKLWAYLEHGGKRAVEVAHRRWGKDDVALHWAAVSAIDTGHPQAIGKVGNYWHMLPQASQARKAVWDAVNPKTGLRRIDEAFPKELRDVTRENEMFIRFKNGSTWQVIGSDNYNSLVGSPPYGVVFSEWALADPQAWGYLRPILLENGGWALFIYTPRGRNHGATFYEGAGEDKTWFAERARATETDVFTPEQLERERAEYKREFGETDGESRFRQEYLCDFEAAIQGAFYGHEMLRVTDDSRINLVPWEPKLQVVTGWDIGKTDSTAIWFAQYDGLDVRIIDYLENSGVGPDWYAKKLHEKPYTYSMAALPHDAEPAQFTSMKSTQDILKSLGLKTAIVRRHKIMDGINEARRLLARCRFDKVKTARGVECMRNYRREWDEEKKSFKDTPLHDWSSHGADAFRSLAMYGVTPKAQKIKYPERSFV